jgi:hypothetical protein
VTRRRRIYASRGKAEIEHKTVIGLTALRQWSLKGATVSRRGYLSALGSMLDRAEVDLVHIHGRTDRSGLHRVCRGADRRGRGDLPNQCS